MNDYINEMVTELLHIDEGATNKLIDLEARDIAKTFYLTSSSHSNVGEYAISIIKERIGKVGNTILKDSSLSPSFEQRLGNNLNMFEWRGADGVKDSKLLNKFIDGIYKELFAKGNNPLFISVGALKWKIEVKKDEYKTVTSPLMIFPIKLVRGSSTNPVAIEFVNDDAYFNPCLYQRMKRDLISDIASSFPHPHGEGFDFDAPLDLDNIDTAEYFEKVKEFIDNCRGNDEKSIFEFDPNIVAISYYNHNEICMYYDIKRNKEKILAHHLIKRMFGIESVEEKVTTTIMPELILPYDSVQEKMIREVVNGKSMVIKGPPGTGKTLTIANMIVSLIASGKKVLVASKKLAALSEVYAKVPEKLRKFLLLLDSESEAEAAKINPSTIKKELKAILTTKKNFTISNNVKVDKDFAEKERARAIAEMTEHVKATFKNRNIFGSNYYEAIDIFCKDENIPIYEFSSEYVLRLTREIYNNFYTIISEIGEHYLALGNNDEHTVFKCPWYGITETHNIDQVYEKYCDFTNDMNNIKDILDNNLFNNYEEDLNDLSLFMIENILDGEITLNQINVLLNSEIEQNELLNKNLNNYLESLENNKYIDIISKLENVIDTYLELTKMNLDPALTKSELNEIKKHLNLFDNENSNFLNQKHLDELWNIVERTETLEKKILEHEFNAWSTFNKEISEEDKKIIISFNDELVDYLEGDFDKPKTLDLKAKKAIKILKTYCYLDNTKFKEIVKAVNELYNADQCIKTKELLKDSIQKIFQTRLEKEEIECLFLLVKKAKKANIDMKTYVSSIMSNYSKYEEYAEVLALENNYKVKDVMDVYKLAHHYQVLRNNLEVYNNNDVIFNVNDPKDIIKIVKSVMAIFELRKVLKEKDGEFINKLIESLKEINNKYNLLTLVKSLVNKFILFASEEFINYYSAFPSKLTINDFNIFVKEATDRELIGSALKYNKLVNADTKVLKLNEFFEAFEKGIMDRKGYNFEDIFEHSIYYVAIKASMENIGSRRFDVGKSMESSFTKFLEEENKIREKNIDLIEAKLMNSINENDKEFSFLNLEKDDSTLRKLFKLYPKAILKLKRCFIISPSTASLLFRNEEYENFDVVIVDEASQLEPVTVLPVFYRAKQCVVVGDEWQMPPIQHFKTKHERNIEDYDSNLEPDASALTVILNSKNFDAYALECHYRSKTESLIRFSQKRFYPNMKTFPSPVPKKEDLGFKDIYVENATSDGGINIKEANVVVEELRKHFDKYFIDGKLIESIGIVTFGEKQRDKIRNLVDHDEELSSKIRLAIQNKDKNDVDEKVIFFKTIEEVQGQEASHLIISFTYGVDKNGNQQNRFGELNRDKLGQCIFNVAVTRSQKSMTVVHSVRARDIDANSNAKIAYIKEYLEISEFFSIDGKEQFVSKEIHKGFISQVGEYIKSLGIDEDRIVYDYGVTEGSIRIPIAILSMDKQKALCGLFLEKDLSSQYHYLDYNIRYYNILKTQYDWNLYRVFIHDWIYNKDIVKNKLKEIIESIN